MVRAGEAVAARRTGGLFVATTSDRKDDLMDQTQDVSLEGWNIVGADEAEWVPWTGSAGEARAKILGTADGYMVTLVEAQPGYAGSPHEHANAEFNYVVRGTLRNQGQQMSAGDGYAAAAGSTHTDFETETGATYIVIFKI
jgi:quercetin dioxygenase-like cupin family protein